MKKVIKEAGKATLQFYEKEQNVIYKDPRSPVTEADLAAEDIILEGLSSFGYAILSEETEDDLSRLTAEKVWIIDPLDGTKDFIQKTGDFSIMVGLSVRGEVVLGCVYVPVKDLLYYAVKGEGAFCEDGEGMIRQISVSKVEDFAEARMLVSRNHLLDFEQKLSATLGVKNLIPCGSAGFKSSLVADAVADIYINSSDRTFEWDICAADIIVSEAGGVVSDMSGAKIVYNKKDPRNLDGFVVANELLRQQIISFCKANVRKQG